MSLERRTKSKREGKWGLKDISRGIKISKVQDNVQRVPRDQFTSFVVSRAFPKGMVGIKVSCNYAEARRGGS